MYTCFCSERTDCATTAIAQAILVIQIQETETLCLGLE